MRIATNRSLKSRLLEGLPACYAMPVVGFPWIVVESASLAFLLLVPILAWLLWDLKSIDPEIRF